MVRRFLILVFALALSNSAWSAQRFLRASYEGPLRDSLKVASRALHVSPSFSSFVLPTYDKAFKELLNDSEVRNSLFRGFVDETIQSSEILGLSNRTLKDQDQVTMESVGVFLNRYKSLIDDYSDKNPSVKHRKSAALSANTLVHELATKYYKPLCTLFPLAEKESYMDFTCCLEDGSTILVEMQVRTEPYWNSRALAYAARVYSSQLVRGQSWGKLKKVYAINILGGHEPSKGKDVRYSWETHAGRDDDGKSSVLKRYQLVNLHNPTDKIPDLEIIQIFPQLFLRDSTKLKDLGLKDTQASLATEWLELFKDAQMKNKTYVDQKVKDQGVKKAYGILERKELADNYQEWVEKYGPRHADEIVQEAAAAKEEGKEEEKREIAKSLLRDKIDKDVVARNTGLSIEQVMELSKNIGSE
jgi:predicted transposase/invertase (TIGR01784 family)